MGPGQQQGPSVLLGSKQTDNIVVRKAYVDGLNNSKPISIS